MQMTTLASSTIYESAGWFVMLSCVLAPLPHAHDDPLTRIARNTDLHHLPQSHRGQYFSVIVTLESSIVSLPPPMKVPQEGSLTPLEPQSRLGTKLLEI